MLVIARPGRLAPLMKSGSALERMRSCIVRCGATEGPVDAIVVLAAALRKKVYVLNYRYAVAVLSTCQVH